MSQDEQNQLNAALRRKAHVNEVRKQVSVMCVYCVKWCLLYECIVWRWNDVMCEDEMMYYVSVLCEDEMMYFMSVLCEDEMM